MEVQLALSGHPFQAWHPDELLEAATSRFGLPALDYWPGNRGALDLDAYRRLVEERRAHVCVVNVPGSRGRLGLTGQEDSFEEALLDAVGEAHALGATFVQFYTAAPRWSDGSTSPRILSEQLKPLIERAERSGITLLIENNLDQRGEAGAAANPSRTADMILSLIELAGSDRLRVCFDPCNFHAVGEEPFPHSYELLRPYIANIHAKDCRRYSHWRDRARPSSDHLLVDSLHGAFLPVPLGLGAVNWEGVFRRLRADGYKGWVTLDPFCSAEHLVSWCEASLPFLRSQVEKSS